MKLTEERIREIIAKLVYDDDGFGLQGVFPAASAIFAAHEQEVKELREGKQSNYVVGRHQEEIHGGRPLLSVEAADERIEELEKENALLKQSQKDFAKFVREQVDNYKAPKEDWERIRNMNWNQLYEYWKH